MSTNLHVMGNRIRTARQFRRLTGEQLAEKLGISVTSLRHIENGIRRPSYQLLDEMSDILDVSMDYLARRKHLWSAAYAKNSKDLVSLRRKKMQSWR